MLTAGAGFLSWIFLISPYLQNPALTPLEKAISVAYPSYDILVLAILTRMALVDPTVAGLASVHGCIGAVDPVRTFGNVEQKWSATLQPSEAPADT